MSRLIDEPDVLIKYLLGFVLLLVPTSAQVYLQALGEYANESGYWFIGNPILFVTGLVDQLTMWVVSTFLEAITMVVTVLFVVFFTVGAFVKLFRH